MKNRLSFSKLVETLAIVTAADSLYTEKVGSKKRKSTEYIPENNGLVDTDGRLTPVGRLQLLKRIQRYGGADNKAIESFERQLRSKKIPEPIILKLSKQLRDMLTSTDSLFTHIVFRSSEDRNEALAALLSPNTPEKHFVLRPTEQRAATVDNINALLEKFYKEYGLIGPAHYKAQILYVGKLANAGLGALTETKRPSIEIYKGDFSQLLIDFLEGFKNNPQKAKEDLKKNTQSKIDKIKKDPKLNEQQKQGLISRMFETISQFFSRLFRGKKSQPTNTPTTSNTPTTPTGKTLASVIFNRLYKNADKVVSSSGRFAIKTYLKGVQYALSSRVAPSEIEVLSGSEVIGNLEDIFDTKFSLYSPGKTSSDDYIFEIGIRHPRFKNIFDLTYIRQAAREAERKYPKTVLDWEERKEGDTIIMTFVINKQDVQDVDIRPVKEPYNPYSPGKPSSLNRIISEDNLNFYRRLMTFLPTVKETLLSLGDRNEITNLSLRIVYAFELYDKAFKGRLSEEMIKPLDLLREGLDPDFTANELLSQIQVQASSLEKTKLIATLLKRVPDKPGITYDVEKASKKLRQEAEKMSLPDDPAIMPFSGDKGRKEKGQFQPGEEENLQSDRAEISFSRSRATYDTAISNLTERMNALEKEFPNNLALKKVIEEARKTIDEAHKAGQRVSSKEIKTIEKVLERLSF